MHEFDHTVTSQELEAFAEAVLGERDLSANELAHAVKLNPVAWKAWNAARHFTLKHVLVGKEVSLDVSTNDIDAGNRIFGKVTELQHHRDEFIILVEEASRNFDQKRLELDAAIGGVVWKYIDRMNDHCDRDTPERIVDAFTEAVNPHIMAAIEYVQAATSVTQAKKRALPHA